MNTLLISSSRQENNRNISSFFLRADHVKHLPSVAYRHLIVKKHKIRTVKGDAPDRRHPRLGKADFVIFLQELLDRLAHEAGIIYHKHFLLQHILIFLHGFLKIFFNLRHRVLDLDVRSHSFFQQMRRAHAKSKISCSCIKQEAELHFLLFKNLLKLLVVQKVLCLHLTQVGRREISLKFLHELFRRISGCIYDHGIDLVSLHIYHFPNSIDEQPFLKNKDDIPFFVSFGFIYQPVINSISEFLPSVLLADYMRL